MDRLILDGKTAIVTGSGRGIGEGIARLYAQEGAEVVLVDLNPETLNSVVESINSAGGKATGIVGDVSSLDSCKEVFAKTLETYGKLDVLVNNAALGGDLATIEETDDDLWLRTMNVNVTGVFYYCREAVRYMLPRKSGSIINVASTNGVRPLCGCAYSTSKGAILKMAHSIAIRVAGTGVRMNSLCPGYTETPTSLTMYTEEVQPATGMRQFVSTLSNRNCKTFPENQANAALFLASDLSKAVNGLELKVDNGSYL